MLGDPNATTGGQTDPNIKTQPGQNPPIFDSVVTLSTAYTWAYGQDVINGVIHELSEGILGRTGFGVWAGAFSTMDLFRYALADSQHPTPWLDTKNGTDGITTYFSSDGGKTLSSVPFNNQYTSPTSASNGGDAADWPNTAPNAYWVFGNTNAGETFTLDQTELNIVQALGWNVSLPQAVFTAASDSWETPPAWAAGFAPITPQDALIGSGAAAVATCTDDVTVNSIATSKLSTLNILGQTVFSATNGTQPNPIDDNFTGGNLGNINVGAGSTLHIGNTFYNVGSLTLGTNSNTDGSGGQLALDGTVTLTGHGNVYMGQASSNFTVGVLDSFDVLSNNTKLINIDNTIEGGGQIWNVSFDNQSAGVVDANQHSGHALSIDTSSFSNEGAIMVESQSILDLGSDVVGEQLNNTGTVLVSGQGDLQLSGNFEVTGSGSILFDGTGAEITSDGAAPATFTNASTIYAYHSGQIGDIGTGRANDLTFVNNGLVQVSYRHNLTLNTGSNAIYDYAGGTLEATQNGANLEIDSNVNIGPIGPPGSTGGTIEADSGGKVTLGPGVVVTNSTVVTATGQIFSGQIVVNKGELDMLPGAAVLGGSIDLTAGTLNVDSPAAIVDVSGNSSTVNLNNASANIDGGGDIINITSGAGQVFTLSNTGSTTDTVNVSGYYGEVDLNAADANFVGGIQTVNAGSGNTIGLSNTDVYTDGVYGSNDTVNLYNASAAIVGGYDVVNFTSASGNVANLWNTGSMWDAVTGFNGTINMYNAVATVTGGNDTIYFGTSADAVGLYNTGSAWDTVNGSNGRVTLNNANATITGGNDNIIFSTGSGNVATLSNTGSAVDTVSSYNNSSGTVNLNSANATITGGNDIVNISAGYHGYVATLSNTGGNADNLNVSGYYGEVDLNAADANFVGGIQTVNAGSGNTIGLSNTDVYTDNLYNATNDTVTLSSAQAAIVGDTDTVIFSGSGNVANLWNTFSAWDTIYNGVNGTDGTVNTVNLMNTKATINGGNDIINFVTWKDDEASLSGTGANTQLNGSNGTIDLFNAQAIVTGTNDNFVFEAQFGQDSITGFGATDTMTLSASDFGGTWAGVQSQMAQSGSNTVITLDANNAITLVGVDASSLQSSQFHFA
jgi:hypothetical protein